MELEKNKNIELEKNNKKDIFLNSTLWKTVNGGIDIGLRAIFPEFIENEIIDLKNNLINFGLKNGIKKTIDSVINTGKQALGIFSGNFENIDQVEKVIVDSHLIDAISDLLDVTIDKATKDGKLDFSVGKAIKIGKKSILSNVENNLKESIKNQKNEISKIEKYINNWNDFYKSKNFSGMEKEFNKIEKELKKLVPLENILKNARYIENIHNLIKNNGNNFELTEEEVDLANKFC